MNKQRERFMSIGEAARLTGVSVKRIRSWEERGYIPSPQRIDCDQRFFSNFSLSFSKESYSGGRSSFLWMEMILSSSVSNRQLTISSIILTSRFPSIVMSLLVSMSFGGIGYSSKSCTQVSSLKNVLPAVIKNRLRASIQPGVEGLSPFWEVVLTKR